MHTVTIEITHKRKTAFIFRRDAAHKRWVVKSGSKKNYYSRKREALAAAFKKVGWR